MMHQWPVLTTHSLDSINLIFRDSWCSIECDAFMFTNIIFLPSSRISYFCGLYFIGGIIVAIFRKSLS